MGDSAYRLFWFGFVSLIHTNKIHDHSPASPPPQIYGSDVPEETFIRHIPYEHFVKGLREPHCLEGLQHHVGRMVPRSPACSLRGAGFKPLTLADES